MSWNKIAPICSRAFRFGKLHIVVSVGCHLDHSYNYQYNIPERKMAPDIKHSFYLRLRTIFTERKSLWSLLKEQGKRKNYQERLLPDYFYLYELGENLHWKKCEGSVHMKLHPNILFQLLGIPLVSLSASIYCSLVFKGYPQWEGCWLKWQIIDYDSDERIKTFKSSELPSFNGSCST